MFLSSDVSIVVITGNVSASIVDDSCGCIVVEGCVIVSSTLLCISGSEIVDLLPDLKISVDLVFEMTFLLFYKIKNLKYYTILRRLDSKFTQHSIYLHLYVPNCRQLLWMRKNFVCSWPLHYFHETVSLYLAKHFHLLEIL